MTRRITVYRPDGTTAEHDGDLIADTDMVPGELHIYEAGDPERKRVGRYERGAFAKFTITPLTE